MNKTKEVLANLRTHVEFDYASELIAHVRSLEYSQKRYQALLRRAKLVIKEETQSTRKAYKLKEILEKEIENEKIIHSV